MPKPNKQHDVRAASFLRMAKDHRKKSTEHRKAARDSRASEAQRIVADALSQKHSEDADILEKEATLLRDMR